MFTRLVHCDITTVGAMSFLYLANILQDPHNVELSGNRQSKLFDGEEDYGELVYVCVCVYMYVHMHVYTHTHTHARTHTHTHTRAHTHTHTMCLSAVGRIVLV